MSKLKLYKVGVKYEFAAVSEHTLHKRRDRSTLEDLFGQVMSDGMGEQTMKFTVSRITSIDDLPDGWNGDELPWGENDDEFTCNQILDGVEPGEPDRDKVLGRLRAMGHITERELEALEND